MAGPLSDVSLEPLKIQLAERIAQALRDQGMTQLEASLTTGVASSEFSRICRGDLHPFKVDRLIKILIKLGYAPRLIL